MKQCSNEKGFTLLEVLVAIAVLGLVMAGASGIFSSVQQAWRKQRNTLDLVQNARWAMEFMANEVRHATVSAAPAWAQTQIILVGNGIQLGRDSDGDNDVDIGDIQVQFRRPAGATAQIQRRQRTRTGPPGPLWSAWSAWEELANFIVLPNPSGNALFTDAGGGLYTIELTVRPQPTQPVGRENRDYTLRTQVRARN